MTLSPTWFDLPKNAEIDEIIDKLQNQFAVGESPAHSVSRIYLDTFDWRLFAANLKLQCEIVDKTHTFTLRKAAENRLIASVRSDKPLRMLEDFPECGVKKRLSPVIEMRALLPVVSLRSQIQPLTVYNADKKIILKLRIEKNKVLKKSGGAGIWLNQCLVLQPVRGYPTPFHSVCAFLRDELQRSPDNRDTYSKALVKLKIQPGGYSSKLDVQLEPEMRSDLATKKILLQLLRTLQANQNGTMENLDSEFLHDFRVACRRTRSALGQIKAVFPDKIVQRYKREFAWLQTVTGPTRDLDVYLLSFPEYSNSIPEQFQNALQPLHDFLCRQQSVEHKKLAHALQTQHYEHLLSRWQQFLEAPVPDRTTQRNATRPISEVANERVWKMYKRVIREGQAITDQSPPEDLHELRKSCKKLRYLMEFFSRLYLQEPLSMAIKALKQLQNNLGDYNDLHVQIASLHYYSNILMENHPPPPETFLAMGALIESLDKKQQSVRHQFHTRFQQFNAPRYHTLFQRLFSHHNPEGGVDS